MATCKECLHNGVCGGYIPSDLDRDVFDYCREGRTDEIPDIEERCNSFNDKSKYVEVRRGEWNVFYSCGAWHYDCPFCDDGYATKYKQKNPENFCSNCGADMRGNNNDNRTEN